MAFLDRLTSPQAISDAKLIKELLRSEDLTKINSLYQDTVKEVDAISYDDLGNITVSRNFYELNKSIRRRNAMFKKISPLLDKYSGSRDIFKVYEIADDEIKTEIGVFQQAFQTMNSIYLLEKYFSKELSFFQTAIDRALENAADTADRINEFREYFFEA